MQEFYSKQIVMFEYYLAGWREHFLSLQAIPSIHREYGGLAFGLPGDVVFSSIWITCSMLWGDLFISEVRLNV